MALHNYHSAYKELPTHLGGTAPPRVNGVGVNTTAAQELRPPTGHNNLFLSAMVGLTPFMEQQALWEQISNSYQSENPPGTSVGVYQSMGPRSRHSRASQRGIFVPRVAMKFRDILDDVASTIAMGEICTDLGDRDIRTHLGSVLAGGLRPWAAGGAVQREQWKDPSRPQF